MTNDARIQPHASDQGDNASCVSCIRSSHTDPKENHLRVGDLLRDPCKCSYGEFDAILRIDPPGDENDAVRCREAQFSQQGQILVRRMKRIVVYPVWNVVYFGGGNTETLR